ncbi:MAG: aldehyde dehydrogenase, partial [Planctomycetia bacterium]
MLGAGNVTGLSCADALCQVFEHGRAVLLKLHPVQAGIEPVLRRALAPLVEAGLLAIVVGDPQFAREAVAAAAVTPVHLTGGEQAFESLVWGGPGRRSGNAPPLLSKPVTCELGNVTPWIVVPGRYTAAQLACQADTVAASIVNNTSFNCIATKCLVTSRGWRQREEFLGLVRRRLESLPARPAWYPGATAAWEAATGRPPPDDGTLPVEFRTGLDAASDRRLLEREWFVPVAVETVVEADDMEDFCTRVAGLVQGIPGSLAASVSLPKNLPPRDRQRAELLIGHLEYGVVAVNGWAAIGYSWGSVPWGGFPGATLAAPGSGIGRVHDPLMLPLVH